jgi:hypothetical protein
LRQSGLAQLDDGTQKTGDQFFAFPARFVLLQQQITEPLFEAVDEVQGRPLGQVRQQTKLLLGSEGLQPIAGAPQPTHQFKLTVPAVPRNSEADVQVFIGYKRIAPAHAE